MQKILQRNSPEGIRLSLLQGKNHFKQTAFLRALFPLHGKGGHKFSLQGMRQNEPCL
jgi:hypothetical protein